MKTCDRCKNIKDHSMFNANKKSADGLQNYCKACSSEYFKEFSKRKKTTQPIFVESKQCIKCNLIKPRSQFGRRAVSKDGLNNYCKVCWRRYLNERRTKVSHNDATKIS